MVFDGHLKREKIRHALVTGFYGFTGQYVGARLDSAGFKVTGASISADRAGNAEDVTLDICDLQQCIEVLNRLRPTHIVHLAARSFVADADELGFYESNVLGTLNLLKACEEIQLIPDRIVIASSANVYGNSEGVIDESSIAAPVNHYAASKWAMECMVKTWMDRLPIVITRPFNYTGRGQSDRFLVPKIISHFRERRDRIELGNIDVARDFSDVRFVAAAYQALLENEAAIGQTVNVCNGRAYSLSDILQVATEVTGHNITVQINPEFVRPNEIKVLVGNPSKLQRLAPELQQIELRQTIGWMLEK